MVHGPSCFYLLDRGKAIRKWETHSLYHTPRLQNAPEMAILSLTVCDGWCSPGENLRCALSHAAGTSGKEMEAVSMGGDRYASLMLLSLLD